MNEKTNILDNIFETLFSPKEAFEKMRELKPIIQAFMIVITISTISPILNFSFGVNSNILLFLFNLFNAAVFGVISWIFFASFIEIIANLFKKGGNIKSFLCLSAFSLLPWIFIAPVTLLKTGGVLASSLGVIIGLLVWLWVSILTIYAIMKSYNISSGRVFTFLLIPFLGSIISFSWFIGFFSTLTGIVKI